MGGVGTDPGAVGTGPSEKVGTDPRGGVGTGLRGVRLIAPYATWMVLMALLPATPVAYAVRTVVVALLLLFTLRTLTLRTLTPRSPIPHPPFPVPCSPFPVPRSPFPVPHSPFPVSHSIIRLFGYFLIGLFVFVLWILPEQFDWTWYRTWCIVGEGGTRAVAEASAALIAMRLIGSAFVVSVAEELFFRRWMIGFAGFWWTVALFAVEHDRWLVGAVAGVIYGGLYLRRGLGAAIVAHATTNLVLGLWVLRSGQWQFW